MSFAVSDSGLFHISENFLFSTFLRPNNKYSPFRKNNLVKKNESLNSRLIIREEQIQKQANKISDTKNPISNVKEVVNDTNVDMLEKDMYA